MITISCVILVRTRLRSSGINAEYGGSGGDEGDNSNINNVLDGNLGIGKGKDDGGFTKIHLERAGSGLKKSTVGPTTTSGLSGGMHKGGSTYLGGRRGVSSSVLGADPVNDGAASKEGNESANSSFGSKITPVDSTMTTTTTTTQSTPRKAFLIPSVRTNTKICADVQTGSDQNHTGNCDHGSESR
eukprot:TRINITY_DN7487_c0_g1_i3.p1 TRINITY_DN7487_c0_g1~~TRINITY_DN7487_c0_g1_i3.p1  ORF type:complete len:186 (-),score=56.10 TRINITY_DN7487_c0_g1_i3:224-781(-)